MYKFLPEVKISQVHGRLHKVEWNKNPIFVLPMYHPAAALRNGNVKKLFVSDFEKIGKIINWIDSQKENIAFESSVKNALF